jgi:hypothetical protein
MPAAGMSRRLSYHVRRGVAQNSCRRTHEQEWLDLDRCGRGIARSQLWLVQLGVVTALVALAADRAWPVVHIDASAG